MSGQITILLALVIALVAAAIALRAMITAWLHRRQEQQLPVEGRIAEARVVDRRIRHTGRGARRFVTYRFIADRANGPHSVVHEAKVHTAEFARLPEGIRVPVTYLPSNPHVSQVINGGV